MNVISSINDLLASFQPLFNAQGYALFSSFILGILCYPKRKTITGIYQACPYNSKYWSMVKFLSRGKWEADLLAQKLLQMIQKYYENWVYIYDETHTIKTGKAQFGLHFFRNYRYQKRNTNQSKFHWGHQFAALGILCFTASQAILFPIWVKMIIPGDEVLNSLEILKSIANNIPLGLIIMDRGFNNRKVFKVLLDFGHHILCRAKCNAVFYYPKVIDPQIKRRGPKGKYGQRVSIPDLNFCDVCALGQVVSVASAIVWTKMCPQQVRLVVRRTREDKSKPYKYFMVYTTDMSLPIETILRYYRLRWELETAFRDTKQNFGFDNYQVRSHKSISRFVQLSFVATSVMQLMYSLSDSIKNFSLNEVLETLGIYWYKPSKLTRGLMQSYVQCQTLRYLFSSSKVMFSYTQKKQRTLMKAA
jgi:Transposase DDE domain/DDE superfamily endonuclease